VPSHLHTLAPLSFGPPKSTAQTANCLVQPLLRSLWQILCNGHPFPPKLPLPMGIYLEPHLTHDSMAHPSPQPKRHLDPYSRFCTDDRRMFLYFTMGHPFPQKLPIPMGDLDPHLITWFPGPTHVLNPNGISICFTMFAGLTSVTDRPTDRPRYSVGNNRPHLCM